MQPKFLYFDLGKVLVDFSVELMLEQVGAVAGISAEAARVALYGEGLIRQHEAGQISSRQLYEAFCRITGSRPDCDRFAKAVCEIFELNLPMLSLVTQLHQAGYPMGILSNTSTSHWEYCHRYRILDEAFKVHALSFRIGALKPEAAIFRAAAEMAGVRPEEIFYVDDLPEHVSGARAVGFDAVQFTTAADLAVELRQRGVRINY